VTGRRHGGLDDLLRQLHDDVTQANAEASLDQKALGWGDFFVTQLGGLPIFGHIYTREDLVATEQQGGTDPVDVADIVAAYDHSFTRGWRLSTCYSTTTPTGEVGDVHVSTLHPISAAQFDWASSKKWDIEEISADPGPWR
jgi:hypothetical protein